MVDEEEILKIVGEDLISKCCEAKLEDAPREYMYVVKNPDTRWFVCADCGAHWGYHRIKATWRIDPYDYDHNPKVRAVLNLED